MFQLNKVRPLQLAFSGSWLVNQFGDGPLVPEEHLQALRDLSSQLIDTSSHLSMAQYIVFAFQPCRHLDELSKILSEIVRMLGDIVRPYSRGSFDVHVDPEQDIIHEGLL